VGAEEDDGDVNNMTKEEEDRHDLARVLAFVAGWFRRKGVIVVPISSQVVGEKVYEAHCRLADEMNAALRPVLEAASGAYDAATRAFRAGLAPTADWTREEAECANAAWQAAYEAHPGAAAANAAIARFEAFVTATSSC
jgi:hypothetical protein